MLVFPSVREFGALWSSRPWQWAQCSRRDFGGPGDINPEIGFKVSLTNEDDVVSQIEKVLAKQTNDRVLNGCANKAYPCARMPG